MALPIDGLKLSQVRDEIGLPPEASLADCFVNALDAGFDSTYSGNKDRLSNFKNYTHAVTPPVNPGSVLLTVTNTACNGSEITAVGLEFTVSAALIDANTTHIKFIYRTESNISGWSPGSVSIDFTGADVVGAAGLTGPPYAGIITGHVTAEAYNGSVPGTDPIPSATADSDSCP